jgi:hypothetical protein
MIHFHTPFHSPSFSNSICIAMNQSCMKLGMYIMTPKPISTAYFINSSHQFVGLYVYPLIVARQLLGKNVTAATNT